MATAGSINIFTSVSTGGLVAGMETARRSVDTAASSMAAAGSKADKLGKGARGATGGFRAMAGGMKVAAGSALGLNLALGPVAVALGAVAAVGKAFGTSMRVEDKVVQLANAADLAGPEIGAMRDELLALGSATGSVSTEGLIGMATAGARMGVPARYLAEYAEGVSMVAGAIDDMEPDEIATAFGRITNNFGLDAVEGVLSMGSAVDGLADSFATSASAIINVTTRISGMANAMGLSGAESAALAATITAAGVRSEQASGSLGRLIQGMQNAENHANYGLVLGMSAQQFADTLAADPMEAISAFLGALDNMDSAAAQVAMKAVGITGSEDIGVIQLLAGNYEDLGRAVGIANEQFETQSKLQETAAKNAEKSSSRLQRLGNNLTRLGDQIGRFFAPLFNWVLDQVNGLLETIAGAVTTVADWLGMAGQKADELAEATDAPRAKIELAIPPAMELADELGKVADAGESVFEAADQMEDLRRKAQSVFEATRTPLENLNAEVRELRDLLTLGLIDPTTFSRAVEQAQEQARKQAGKTSERVGFAGALSAGSQEARSLLLGHRNRSQDEGLKLARASLSTQVKMLSHLAGFANGVPRAVPVKLPS